MTDPYQVLGVSPSCDGRTRVKGRLPGAGQKVPPRPATPTVPSRDLAEEKMKEINEAYDQIHRQRKGGGAGTGYNGAYNNVGQNGSSGFNDVRSLIMSGRIADAEQILNGVPPERRNAEWYFLKGGSATAGLAGGGQGPLFPGLSDGPRQPRVQRGPEPGHEPGQRCVRGLPAQYEYERGRVQFLRPVLFSDLRRLLLRVHGRRPDLLLLSGPGKELKLVP